MDLQGGEVRDTWDKSALKSGGSMAAGWGAAGAAVLDENRLAAATILCPGDLAGVCGFLMSIRGTQNNSQFIKTLMKHKKAK
jgi:hypothetical protein